MRMNRILALCLVSVLATTLSFVIPSPARACDSPRTAREATSSDIRAFVRDRGMNVLTFAGYSGAEYEDPAAMLAHASRVLDAHDPAKIMVNIGATAQGIGSVYELAKHKGFVTIGIVSVLARDNQVPLSPRVDFVFYVRDASWGGRLPGSNQLSPTSAAIVANSASIVGIGGGEIARDEMLSARRASKSVTFIPADMNHQLARDKALKKGTAAPTDFRGAADAALAKGT